VNTELQLKPVCPSNYTRRYCIQTAKRRITQRTPGKSCMAYRMARLPVTLS